MDWKMPEGENLRGYQDGQYTLTYGPSDWHPYNPNAKRDARIVAEGIYTDLIHQVTTFNGSGEEIELQLRIP